MNALSNVENAMVIGAADEYERRFCAGAEQTAPDAFDIARATDDLADWLCAECCDDPPYQGGNLKANTDAARLALDYAHAGGMTTPELMAQAFDSSRNHATRIAALNELARRFAQERLGAAA
jgi:hypothetical protein